MSKSTAKLPPLCTIIPPYMLRNIAASSDAPEEVKDRCNFTLQHNEMLWRNYRESQESGGSRAHIHDAAGGVEHTSTTQRPRPTPGFIIPPAIQHAVVCHLEAIAPGSEEHQAALRTIETAAAIRKARATALKVNSTQS